MRATHSSLYPNRAGHWADDVAQTVVILAAADLPRATRLAIRAFLAVYLAGFDRDTVRTHLPAAIERRMADPNMTAQERELIPRVSV